MVSSIGEGTLGRAGEEYVFELSANCSLTPRGARRFMVGIAAVTLAVALYCTAYGYWPVLIYAIVEILALDWALRYSMRAAAVRETITITDQTVTISHREPSAERVAVFPRHWSRVTLHAPQAALHPSRLLIESCGRACEVGRFLTEEERRGLAMRLKQLVGNVNDSPAL
jgi:uncharacterized membrane protein